MDAHFLWALTQQLTTFHSLDMKTIISFLTISTLTAQAADWPTWRKDNHRSGVTSEQLNDTTLSQSWVFTEHTPPQAAWYGTMKRDAWNNITNPKDARAYDRAFNIIAADDKLFFASSSGNAAVALNANTGAEIWRHPVEGAVRIAPTYDADKLYFGSDDGNAYCVHADTGTLIWKYRGAPSAEMIPADNKFISKFPCRTGILIQGGNAYCGFGLLPWKNNYLASLDAATGNDTGSGHYNQTITAAQWYSFEGPMLATNDRLFILQGRVSPLAFTLSDGSLQGRLPGGGGTFAVITGNNIIHGPGHGNNDWAKDRTFHLQESSGSSRTSVSRHSRAHRVLINGSSRYYLIRDAVQATGGNSWAKALHQPECLIMGGTTLYVGSKNLVTAYNSSNGTILKQLAVDGDVYGLAIANGKLFATTHTGKIYCFE